MKKTKTFYVALYGIMLAAIAVAMVLDRFFSSGLPISTAATVLLVMFSFAFVKNEWQIAFFAGVFFGLASLIKEFILPSELGAALLAGAPYLLPVQYLLTRVPVGIAGFGVYKLFLSLTKNSRMDARVRQALSISLGTLGGLIVNTVLFLGCSIIIKGMLGMEYKAFFVVIWAAMFTNIIPEYLISVIGAPLVVLGVRKGLHLGTEALPQPEE